VLALGTENKNKKVVNLKKAVSRKILKKSRFGREMQSTNFQQLCVFLKHEERGAPQAARRRRARARVQNAVCSAPRGLLV